jgi:nucleolar pre-ribosomal-associated protein 2
VTDENLRLRKLVRRRLLSAQKPGKSITSPLMQCISLFPVQQLHEEEQQLFIRETQQRLSSMTTEKLTEFIHDLQSGGFSGEHASYRLLLAGLAVSCLKEIEDRDSSASLELSSLCTRVSEVVPDSDSIEQFSLATECLEVLLRTRPRSISQWNIDSILGAIAVSVSGSGPRIAPDYAGAIYTRLCRLVGVVFGLYRKKLGGRFHLVLPIMQRLLHCLFPMDAKPGNSKRATSTQQPPWMIPTATTTTNPLSEHDSGLLQPDHAMQYTRLLTSLCDPTVSAVGMRKGAITAGHGRPEHELTDQTKKAKSIAGQHLQYLIMAYAQGQLSRRPLGPTIKAALMPGLYAVLDVISRETMRTMNAALDASGRAVFKGLYDDYMRFGRWDQN